VLWVVGNFTDYRLLRIPIFLSAVPIELHKDDLILKSGGNGNLPAAQSGVFRELSLLSAGLVTANFTEGSGTYLIEQWTVLWISP
jgi:hypothetical protein